MGIPCVVGTGIATKTLKEGSIITVNATHGNVYAGKLEEPAPAEAPKPAPAPQKIITATQVKVIMDLPDYAAKAAETGADGVGLVRIEIMIAQGKIHPAEYIRQKKTEENFWKKALAALRGHSAISQSG
jgi:pyruvate,water dikinase